MVLWPQNPSAPGKRAKKGEKQYQFISAHRYKTGCEATY